MTRLARNTRLLVVMAACLGVSACGGEDSGDPIPADKAARLDERLDAVEQAVENDCDTVATRIQAAQVTAGSLDEDGVGEDVQDALADGIDNLRDLADRECSLQPEEEPETTPETTPEPIPTTPEPTTPEPTTPEPTTPEPTTPEPLPPEEEEEEEPDEGDGGAQFDPDGKVPPGQAKKGGDE